MKKTGGVLAVFVGMSLSGAGWAANNSTVTFSATIDGGTCDFSVLSGTTGDAATTAIALGNVDATPLIGTNQHTTAPTAFRLRSACKGMGPAVPGTPTVTLAGTSLGATVDGSKKLFRSSGSTSSGLGIAVATGTGSTITWSNIKGAGDNIPTTLTYSGTSTAHNNDINMLAAVACGTTTDCAAANLGAGTLTAAVTFTLAAP